MSIVVKNLKYNDITKRELWVRYVQAEERITTTLRDMATFSRKKENEIKKLKKEINDIANNYSFISMKQDETIRRISLENDKLKEAK